MRFNALWWFVPMEALPLILVGGALLVIIGRLRPGRLLVIVGGFAMLPLVAPVIEGVLDILPWWVVLGVVLVVAVSMFRGIAAMFIGERAADEMTGSLAASAVRGTLRLAFTLPFA